ncbi:MAG: hypothetical protein Q8K70_00380 [Bacteroidota bacterium]|nr:hypothetical protein [Bacteroidota bacterium]
MTITPFEPLVITPINGFDKVAKANEFLQNLLHGNDSDLES